MKRATGKRKAHWTAIGVAALWLLGGPAAQAQFFPFFDQPERPARPVAPPPAPRTLSPRQIRDILAQEGARPVGKPKLRGPDLVVLGAGEDGSRKRFTLDAFSGEILDITVLARREPPPTVLPPGESLPPGEALPPPTHAPDAAPVGEPLPPPTADIPAADIPAAAPPAASSSASVVAPPAAPAAAAPAAAPKKRDPADAALSPIRPLKPSGAPKVEPMPN